jgi:hypothetical protein
MKSFSDYKPITFKFLGMTCYERLPRSTIFQWLHASRIHIKSLLRLPVSYFDLRALLTPEQQKNGDMWFLTHFIQERDKDAENTSRVERLRYWRTLIRYLPELTYVHSIIYSPESPKHPKQPIIDDYLVRWGYKLDVPPSFIELIHGTDNDSALYASEHLL